MRTKEEEAKLLPLYSDYYFFKHIPTILIAVEHTINVIKIITIVFSSLIFNP